MDLQKHTVNYWLQIFKDVGEFPPEVMERVSKLDRSKEYTFAEIKAQTIDAIPKEHKKPKGEEPKKTQSTTTQEKYTLKGWYDKGSISQSQYETFLRIDVDP